VRRARRACECTKQGNRQTMLCVALCSAVLKHETRTCRGVRPAAARPTNGRAGRPARGATQDRRTEGLLASFAGGTRGAGDLRHRLAGTAGGAGSPEGHGDTPTPPHWAVRAWAQLAVLNGWLVVRPRVLIESTPESIKRALMCGRGECRGTTLQRSS
jgi:hypothetical protein